VHESDQDVETLQRVLDRSFARAGDHLRSVFHNHRVMSAADVVATLQGVFVLHLATVSNLNRPVVAPIDGLFYRSRFLFSAPESAKRVSHLRRRPFVSATYTQGQSECIIVHGRAVEVGTAETHVRTFFEEIYGSEVFEASARPGFTAFIEPNFMVAFGAGGAA
jgi:hypothetical protein